MDTLYKKVLAILMAGIMIGSLGVALAQEDRETTAATDREEERDPYCMREYGHPGLGWGSPEQTSGPIEIGPLELFACEGEHWNGEDSVQPDANNEGECTGAEPGDGVNASAAVFHCDDPGYYDWLDADGPVGVRVSTSGDQDSGGVYTAWRISGVGTAVVFTGWCQEGTERQGARYTQNEEEDNSQRAECPESSTAAGATGVYLRDHTPLNTNILASVISAARLTKGYAGPGDCTQEEYAESAEATNSGEEPTCGRDNTAITVEYLL